MVAQTQPNPGPSGGEAPKHRIMMDVPRESRGKRKRWIWGGAGALVLIVTTVALARLEPAAPAVDRDIIFTGTVEHGTMIRQVRGPGTLVPEHVRFISSVTAGRVERRLVMPGEQVTAETVLMELSNPDVQLEALEAERQLAAAQAALVETGTNLQTQRLNQAGVVATTRSQYQQAERTLRSNEELAAKDLIAENTLEQSRDQVEELRERLEIERQRLALMERNVQRQSAVQEQQVERWRRIVEFNNERMASMQVRAGTDGVLQEVNFEPGQWVQAGTQLAKVVQPGVLKAVLRIPEVQARDVTIGQPAVVDIRSGTIPGHVMRIDPAAQGGSVTVDVALDVEELPRGARPDLSVDGTIEVARLTEVLHMPRPNIGQANSSVGLYRLVDGGEQAVRVTVQLGQTSVNEVEIRAGLEEGDEVILSDMSSYDAYDRVRIR
ncbi:MAG TPA: HlyD family efflux transporter periplasmic adaptor subunit [Longimicrobiales bacterium]|nr:HlyD family efflux transporter periplasmic adaptor subunit [Longimicrobiales bacterium]